MPARRFLQPIKIARTAARLGEGGFVHGSFGEFVARQGMADVPRALACLHALADSGDRTPFEVIVVDDASTDDSVAVATETLSKVTNLFDKYYYLSINDQTTGGQGYTNAQPGRPREWAVTLKKQF